MEMSALRHWCEVSKNLYNQGLYLVRQNLIHADRFVWYSDIEREMKTTLNLEGDVNYRLMPKAQCAQQCLKTVAADLKAYVKSVKDWSHHPEKYKGKPRLPRYKKGLNQLIIPNQSCKIEDGYLILTKTVRVPIPQWEKYGEKLEGFQQVRINPRFGGEWFEIEIVYLAEEVANPALDMGQYASIDLGVGNLATMMDTRDGEALIFNGKQLKAVNQWYNKTLATLKSAAMKCNGKRTTCRIQALTFRRNSRIDDLLHKTSREIVNILLRKGIGTLVVGHNKWWKDEVNLGEANNQNFVGIPFSRFISFLSYKCRMAGIAFVETEEAHTSKCDALALEEVGHHDKYMGRRKKRGLFQSSVGKLLNADVNGALNIMRKVVDDSLVRGIIDRGRLFRPVKLRDLYSLEYVPTFD